IAERNDHPRWPGSDQRIGARRRTAIMTAGLQRNVDRGPGNVDAPLGSLAQGHGFGMRAASTLRSARCDKLPIAHNDASDARIGISKVEDVLCQGECLTHPVLIFVGMLPA